MSKEFVIEQSYYFEARPESVFQALTDSKQLVKWFLSNAEIDAKEGGGYSFDWLEGYNQAGKVIYFENNKAISYSWGQTRLPRSKLPRSKMEHC